MDTVSCIILDAHVTIASGPARSRTISCVVIWLTFSPSRFRLLWGWLSHRKWWQIQAWKLAISGIAIPFMTMTAEKLKVSTRQQTVQACGAANWPTNGNTGAFGKRKAGSKWVNGRCFKKQLRVKRKVENQNCYTNTSDVRRHAGQTRSQLWFRLQPSCIILHPIEIKRFWDHKPIRRAMQCRNWTNVFNQSDGRVLKCRKAQIAVGSFASSVAV